MGSNQVLPQTQAVTTQSNFRQMCGEVQMWNPDAPPSMVEQWVRNAYREIVDRRLWFGLLIRGQITVPNVYATGQVTCTNGSPNVVGTGTVWDATMVGRQFRAGFTTGFYNIVNVTDATHLTLDLPYGNQTLNQVGYQIMQCIVTPGANIKAFKTVVNQRQGYRVFTNIPQECLNASDTWRTSTGWTFMMSPREQNAAGAQQFELYPSPTFQQAFPYLAYVQPPDMVKDSDFPYTFIRSDVIVKRAVTDALVFRGKNSKYYDPVVYQTMMAQYNANIALMEVKDDSQDMKDLRWDFSRWPYSRQGSLWLQQHAGTYDEGM